MRNTLLALTAASMLFLGGCATQATTASKPAEPAGPAISAEAQAALTAAQADVKMAKSKYDLWTTAQSALEAAEKAAAAGDSAGVIKNAKTASEQAQLGIKQGNYPVEELKNL